MTGTFDPKVTGTFPPKVTGTFPPKVTGTQTAQKETNFMQQLYYDLHLHSCLSPCGDDESTPGNIVGMAYVKGLQVIALTDHNTCKNCPAFLKIASDFGITAIPGMELTTAEEVHVVCLFPTLEDAMAFDAYVEPRILPIKNKPDKWGNQIIINEDDLPCGTFDTLLISATDISFDAVYDLLEEYHGVMIPAHIEKSTFSLIANLGFVPPDAKFKCFELKNMARLHEIVNANPILKNCNVITDSDAHQIDLINEPVNTLLVEENTVQSVLQALTRPVVL